MRHHVSRFSGWIAASTLLAIGSCSTPPPSLNSSDDKVVYGEDDREDVYAFSDQAWATRAAGFTAAMMQAANVDATDPNAIRFPSATLADGGICEDERFANQITPGYCSTTLIAPDLVLTAGHCVDASSCADRRFVFDFYMTSATDLHPVTSEDVYSCREVVAHALAGGLDYAVVRLDRPAVGRTPAQIDINPAAMLARTPLIVNGYGSGLPLKIDDGARVINPRTDSLDFFVSNLDTFGGNSGSGVFRADTGRLVGILVRGATDYVTDPVAGCGRVNHCSDAGCSPGDGEESTYAFQAFKALCAIAPTTPGCTCGDATCDAAAGEDTVSCPADCGTRCGDGACDRDETPTTCADDCGTCGNGACDSGETPGNCCTDCGCTGTDECTAGVCMPDPGPGDTCADPLPIAATTATQTFTGSTSSALDDAGGTCVGEGAPERVYAVTVAAAGQLVATMAGYDTGLYLRSTCEGDDTQIACNDDVARGNVGSRVTANVEPGTYYLFADGYDSGGNYTLTVLLDACPTDPAKTEPGVCGCGTADTNTDGDAALDCNDACDADPAKTEVGVCGCGVADTNTDGDAAADCIDACDADPAKTEVGACGCGVADTDTDGDGTADCIDACDADPAKIEVGACGCGVADTNTDGDAAADCIDACDADPAKTEVGACGCGVADTNTDGDAAADCIDACDADPAKTEVGACGCGVADTNTDGDAAPDCTDACDDDAAKTEVGVCGCGVAETNTDGDAAPDCTDACDDDAAKTEVGVCGCGVADTDTDADGTADCNDACPTDATNKCNEPRPMPMPQPQPEPDDEDDGCGCRAGASSHPATGLVFLGFVGLALRRRRRA